LLLAAERFSLRSEVAVRPPLGHLPFVVAAGRCKLVEALLGSRIAGRYAELSRLPFNFCGKGSFGSFVWATARAGLFGLSMFS
jgi:hypothetical protein